MRRTRTPRARRPATCASAGMPHLSRCVRKPALTAALQAVKLCGEVTPRSVRVEGLLSREAMAVFSG